MGKKSKRVRPKQPAQEDGAVAPNLRGAEAEETAENLKFEDPFVDEIVEDEVVDDAAEVGGEEPDDMDTGMEVVQSWHPLMGLPPGEDGPPELEMDPSAYKMYHTLTPEWPALSFDFLKDNLGGSRQRFPHSLQAVVGTQADSPDKNQLMVLQLSDLARISQENEEEDILGDEYDKDDGKEDDESSSDEEGLDLDPVLEHYHLPHYGGVNRVRVMPQQQDIVATWSDVGKVNIYDIESIRSRFASSSGGATASSSSSKGSSNPIFTYAGHGIEGYGLDWSSVNQGNLATGDNEGKIHLWAQRPDGSFEVTPSYESIGGVSVEDIQWSPTESTVLCAAESGGHLAIYDTRAPHRAMLRHLVHSKTKADVNVTSWNPLVSSLLATGGDDGTLTVWDLKQFSSNQSQDSSAAASTTAPLARFSCHQTPITSVEWHPTDESMLAVSDTVGAYVYDLSVEEDDENQNGGVAGQAKTLVADIPPQLLFCHSGSQDFKELHWHPQISSCIMTTAFSGFSVFIPSNL